MELTIIAPKGILCNREIKRASFPGSLGAFTVLVNHAPIVSTLTRGIIKYNPTDEAGEIELSVENGIVEVNNNKIWVFLEQYP